MALMTVRYSPLMPGDPPRTSICIDATFGKWSTVQPVGPSAYSATPTSRPGKSNSSTRFAPMSVRGTSRAVSFVVGPVTGARLALGPKPLSQRAVCRDADRGCGEDLGGDHGVLVSEV